MNKMTIAQARINAKHYAAHTTDGWDGYSADDVADYITDWMEQFFTGTMTFETHVSIHCDEYCQ